MDSVYIGGYSVELYLKRPIVRHFELLFRLFFFLAKIVQVGFVYHNIFWIWAMFHLGFLILACIKERHAYPLKRL